MTKNDLLKPDHLLALLVYFWSFLPNLRPNLVILTKNDQE